MKIAKLEYKERHTGSDNCYRIVMITGPAHTGLCSTPIVDNERQVAFAESLDSIRSYFIVDINNPDFAKECDTYAYKFLDENAINTEECIEKLKALRLNVIDKGFVEITERPLDFNEINHNILKSYMLGYRDGYKAKSKYEINTVSF